MGCCHSRAASESPYAASNAAGSLDNVPNDSSRAAINRPQQALDGGAHATFASSSRKPDGTISRPNKPIQPPPRPKHSPKIHSHIGPGPMTRSVLDQQRREFFETRTNNTREIWHALALVAENMRKGDLAQAQAIMDAANITCPHGRVARGRGKDKQLEGVYDEDGKLYDIPYWIVADPLDVIEDGDEKEVVGDEDDEKAGESDSGLQARRGEKGKGRAEDIGDEVRVTARLNTAKDVTVTLGSKETIGVLKRKIEEQNDVKLRSLIHFGKILKNGQTLEAAGWERGQVLNAFVDPDASPRVEPAQA